MVKQRNMVNWELQTLFHPIVNATKQGTKKELAPMKKTLMNIDGVLTAQREHHQASKAVDNTYGFYKKDGQLNMGNKAV